MNILILNWRDIKHPHTGGAEIVTHEHAKAWIHAGNSVTYFSSYFPGAKSEEVIDGVHMIRRGNPAFGVQIQAFLWYLFSKHDRFDVVIDQFHGIPFFTPLYVKGKKVAFIHEVTKEVWKYNPWPRPFHFIPFIVGGFFEEWIFRILYKKIPFITVSNSTKEDLMLWGISRKNIEVIHNGVVQPVIIKKEKDKKKTVLYLGALAHDKGILEALKTFSLLHQSDNEYQFWIIGKGSATILKELRQVAQDMGIIDSVTFWGYVDDKKKNELLSRAHILIHPSIREGWGLVVIEAAYQGTPSIAYNVPGLRDSIKNGETGVLLIENTPQAMADAVENLLGNPSLYKKIQAECIKWAKSLTWEKSTEKSLSYLEHIVHGS